MNSGDIRKWAQTMFDSIKHTDEVGDEYWLARELCDVLGYASWQGFVKVVDRAKLSILETGQPVDNHFKPVFKMVSLGSDSERKIEDIELTRYACYIIAQNGNAMKLPAVAAAQAYFAIQTRKQELSQDLQLDVERLIKRKEFSQSDKNMSEAIMEKGISGRGLGQIKSSGDKQMFGGKSTADMKREYGIVASQKPLADKMPNVLLAAKSLANEMTAENLAKYPIEGFDDIKLENDSNNGEIRGALLNRGIVPEELPPAEDTEKIKNRLRSNGGRKNLDK